MWKIFFLILFIAALIVVISLIKGPSASLSANKAPLKGRINSIVVSEDRKSTLIDSRIVHEGDTIGGVTVVKIYRDRVEFQKEGTEGIIRWTQKMNEAPKAYWESKTSK